MATGSEKRSFSRTSLVVSVEVGHESFGRVTLRSRDLSASGIFVEHGANPKLPPIGTALSVWLIDDQGNRTRAIRAEIVRVEADGFALRFLEDPFAALA